MENTNKRKVIRTLVSYEDSTLTLAVIRLEGTGDVTFKTHNVTVELVLQSRASSMCFVSYAPGSDLKDLAELIHAITAVVEIAHFPFKNISLKLISLMKSSNTTQLKFAPPSVKLQDVTDLAMKSSMVLIVPMLASDIETTEFPSATWS